MESDQLETAGRPVEIIGCYDVLGEMLFGCRSACSTSSTCSRATAVACR